MPSEILHPPIEDIPPSSPQDIEPHISLHALTSIYAPQTLKLIGYIKHRKIIVLIDSGSTHNFIQQCVTQETQMHPCCEQLSNHDC
jgi:hypothetical protein